MEAVISKESSYKCDNVQYRPEETPLKVAKVNRIEVPSGKMPEVKTQKQTEIRTSKGMCDLDAFQFRFLDKILE